ncbi:hypothetical protein VKT23_001386 [Stygiomarasmius scandens]|uniref:Uncharacterized protein n=1 Tax=Marasmiellus scandens TaxID=2682957 RepID=A0ABR1J2Z6_9AGAR
MPDSQLETTTALILAQDKSALEKMRCLLPPGPTKSGLKCGYEGASNFLPLSFLLPYFYEGIYPTLKPPVFHYGWHFDESDLLAAADKHGLLAKVVLAPGVIDNSPYADVLPDIDVHKTLQNIRLHLKNRDVDIPYLTYACVRSGSASMISVTSNYKGWLPSDVQIRALQDIIGREDRPVWDMDYYTNGWKTCPRDTRR